MAYVVAMSGAARRPAPLVLAHFVPHGTTKAVADVASRLGPRSWTAFGHSARDAASADVAAATHRDFAAANWGCVGDTERARTVWAAVWRRAVQPPHASGCSSSPRARERSRRVLALGAG